MEYGFHNKLRYSKQTALRYLLAIFFFCIILSFYSFGEDKELSILVIGDSNTEYGYITRALADTLSNLFYTGAGGTGYIPLNSSFYAVRYKRYQDISITYSSTSWICMDMFEGTRMATIPYLSPNGHWLKSIMSGAVATVQCPGNGIDIYWLSHSTGGTFSISIDEKIYDTISTIGSQSVQKTSIHGLSTDKHTVHFEVISVPAQGNVTLLGFDAHYGTADQYKRSVVHNWGNGYCTTADFLNIDSTIFVSGLQQCKPDVVVILLGTNDHFQDRRSAPEFKTNLKALINRIKTSEVTANILLTSTFMTNETTGATYLPKYQATAWPEAASETEVEYWDMCAWFGPYDATYMNGSVHCNARGGKKIASEMLKKILQRFPTITSRSTYGAPFSSPSYSIHYTPDMLIVKQKNYLPYQINLFSTAGKRFASLHGSGSHTFRLDRKNGINKPGIYIAKLHIDGRTEYYHFPVVQ